MSRGRKIAAVVVLTAAAVGIGTIVGTSAAGFTPVHGWPYYCAHHPGSHFAQCKTPPTTTTTTSSTTSTTEPASTTTTSSSTTSTTTPATSTTTSTTTPTLFTGCIVVTSTDQSTILFEGSCSDADAWVSAQGGKEFITYPVTDVPACDPNQQRCTR